MTATTVMTLEMVVVTMVDTEEIGAIMREEGGGMEGMMVIVVGILRRSAGIDGGEQRLRRSFLFRV